MKRDEIKALLAEHEERLEKRLGRQLDAKLDDRFAEYDKKLDARFEQNNAVLFGQLSKHFDERLEERLDERIGPLEAKVDRILNILDADTKRAETDDHERAAISSKVDRHEGWIGQLAKKTGTKLVPEL